MKKEEEGLPQQSSGSDCVLQCRGWRFHSWSETKFPYALWQKKEEEEKDEPVEELINCDTKIQSSVISDNQPVH